MTNPCIIINENTFRDDLFVQVMMMNIKINFSIHIVQVSNVNDVEMIHGDDSNS